jgi:hypothetical protein
VCTCRLKPTFPRNILTPSSGLNFTPEDGGSICQYEVFVALIHYSDIDNGHIFSLL